MSVPATKADLDDQRWLDGQIEAIDDGIEAVLDIARNWTDLRNLSRLHPGTSAQDYILARVKTPLGRGVIVPLLEESDWSNVQIAHIAGVTPQAVQQRASNLQVERPAKTLGADGKLRPARVVREVAAEVVEPIHLPDGNPYIDSAPPSAGPSVLLRRFERELRRIRQEYSELATHPRARRFHNVFAAIDAAID